MKSKFSAAISVVVVVLMMGAALVPVMSGGSDETSSAAVYNSNVSAGYSAVDGITESATNNASGTSDISLMGLLNEIISGTDVGSAFAAVADSLPDSSSYGLGSVQSDFSILGTSSITDSIGDLAGVAYVPVASVDYETIDKWDGSDVSGDIVVGLYGGAAATLSDDNGMIGEGATLVLFPTSTNDYSFTLESLSEGSIILENGSYIDIFGLRYKVVADPDYCDGIAIATVSGTVTVESGYDSSASGNKFTAYVELGAYSYLDMYGELALINNESAAQTSANASLMFTAGDTVFSKETTSLSITDPFFKIQSTVGVSGTTGLTPGLLLMIGEPSSDSMTIQNIVVSEGKGSVSVTSSEFYSVVSLDNGIAESPAVLMSASFTTPSCKVTVSNEVKTAAVGGKTAYSITIGTNMKTNDKDAEFTAPKIKVSSIEVSDLKIKANEISVVVCSDNITGKSSITASIPGSSSMTAASLKATVIYEISGATFPITVEASDIASNDTDAYAEINFALVSSKAKITSAKISGSSDSKMGTLAASIEGYGTVLSVGNYETTTVDSVITYDNDNGQSEVKIKAKKASTSVGSLQAVSSIITLDTFSISVTDVDMSASKVAISKKGAISAGDYSVKCGMSVYIKSMSADTAALQILSSTIPAMKISLKEFRFDMSRLEVSKTAVVNDVTKSTVTTEKVKAYVDLTIKELGVSYEIMEVPMIDGKIGIEMKDLSIDFTNITTAPAEGDTTTAGTLDVSLTSFTIKTDSLAVMGYYIKDTEISLTDSVVNMKKSDIADKVDVDITASMSVKVGSFEDYYGTMAVKDAKIDAKEIKVKCETTQSVLTVAVLSGDIEAGFTLSMPGMLGSYEPIVDLQIKGITVTPGEGVTVFAASSASAGVTVKNFDGMDRYIKADAKDVNVTMDDIVSEGDEELSASDFKMIVKMSEANINCDMPLSSMGLSGLGINMDLNFTVAGKNLTIDTKSDDFKVSGDSAEFTGKMSVSNAPYFEGFSLNFSDNFVISGSEATAGNISGYLQNRGEDAQSFAIVNGPKINFANGMNIVSGDAVFAAGYIPFVVTVGKDATFASDGLSAISFNFADKSKVSGTIALDTKENTDPEVSSRYVKIADNVVLSIDASSTLLCIDGYKIVYDLGMSSGTIYSAKGLEVPQWKEGYGAQWLRSDDHQSATFTVPAEGSAFKFACEPLSYNFSYDGETPVAKKYGETFELKDVPAKEKYKALGWSDGYQVYTAGISYVMPARDVVLKAVYANENPDVSKQGEGDAKSVVVKSSDDAVLVVSNSALKEVGKDGTFTVQVNGAKIVMDKNAAEAIAEELSDSNLMAGAKKVESIDNDIMKNIVKDNTLYDVKLMTDSGAELNYSGNVTFKVTVTVKVDRDITGFNASNISDNNETHAVGVLGFVDNGDGTYDVTFECNHFSYYMVEPVYAPEPEPGPNNTALYIVLGIVAVVTLLIIAIGQISKYRTQ